MNTFLMPPLQWGLSSKGILFTYLLPSHKKAKYWGGYIKICLVSAIKHCIKRSIMIKIRTEHENKQTILQVLISFLKNIKRKTEIYVEPALEQPQSLLLSCT